MSPTPDKRAPGAGPTRASLPPRWFVVLFWHAHRALVRVTHGRVGLWRPKPGRWGALWLTTTGRRSGRPRQVLVGYFEDGDNLVTMAMNGWGAAEPALWLNLQTHPDARRRPGTAHDRCMPGVRKARARTLSSRWATSTRTSRLHRPPAHRDRRRRARTAGPGDPRRLGGRRTPLPQSGPGTERPPPRARARDGGRRSGWSATHAQAQRLARALGLVVTEVADDDGVATRTQAGEAHGGLAALELDGPLEDGLALAGGLPFTMT